MLKRLVILIFIVTVVGSALAGVNPHMDGVGGCSMSCCEDARQDNETSVLSRICCVTDCSQPAGTSSTSPTISVNALKQKCSPVALFFPDAEADNYIQHVRFPSSPTRNLTGSSTRFLDTGAFLI